MEKILGTKSWWNFLERLKQKVDLFASSKKKSWLIYRDLRTLYFDQKKLYYKNTIFWLKKMLY